MDSLPAELSLSWSIVAAIAFGPAVTLFVVDAIGWVRRRRKAQGHPIGCPPVGTQQGGSGGGQ